jgi:hypothetical protein
MAPFPWGHFRFNLNFTHFSFSAQYILIHTCRPHHQPLNLFYSRVISPKPDTPHKRESPNKTNPGGALKKLFMTSQDSSAKFSKFVFQYPSYHQDNSNR